MRIELFTMQAVDKAKVLYEKLGWINYLKDERLFYTMFENSLVTYAAYEDEELVGLVRAVGDHAHILYIQDILVLEAYQRQGIGRALMDTLLKAYPHVRQKVLITDAPDEKANLFYQNLGFKKATDYKVQAYVKFEG